MTAVSDDCVLRLKSERLRVVVKMRVSSVSFFDVRSQFFISRLKNCITLALPQARFPYDRYDCCNR